MAALGLLNRAFFKKSGHTLPDNIRVSVGFIKGSSSAIGICCDVDNSTDDTWEIFICPTQDDPLSVLETLLHELVHTAVGLECGHKGDFKEVALKLGFAGKMTATYTEPDTPIHDSLLKIKEKLGPYNHSALNKVEAAATESKWVRYKSETEPKFRVVVNKDRVSEYGVPRDPWDEKMVPV